MMFLIVAGSSTLTVFTFWNHSMKLTLLLLIAGVFLQPSGDANADASNGFKPLRGSTSATYTSGQQRSGNSSNEVKNRQQAAQLIKSKYRAKVLSVQSANIDGKKGYRAKLLDSKGVVFYVFVDAGSGRMRRL